MAETPEERDARLHQLRVGQQQRRAAETQEERDARLHQLRVGQQQRRAAETQEERDARLHQLRVGQQQRRAAETQEERDARLHQLRVGQQQRRAAEIQAERVQPLLHQPAVRFKMSKFHSVMAALQVTTCVTCMERFPGMTVRMTSAGTECIRCTRDKHSPKTFSSDNNMHPGPVPQELMVRGFDFFHLC